MLNLFKTGPERENVFLPLQYLLSMYSAYVLCGADYVNYLTIVIVTEVVLW